MQKGTLDYKIGLLGGGQLGRMLLQSAIDLNLDVSIMDADPDAPCANLAKHFVLGRLTDYDDVIQFGRDKDLITIEIENVNTEALKELERNGVKVYPQPHIIELIQDKRKQKIFYQSQGIPTAEFVLTESKADVLNYLEMIPAVHKLGTGGYDGRGVQMIGTVADIDKAFDGPGVLEKCIDFQTEISVIVARNERGEVMTYPSVELSFHPEENLVEFLFSPANIAKEIEAKAQELAIEVITKLGMVGLLAIEMFLDKRGKLLVNEVAPRTHNSGHHTIEANQTSQFEQHLRAVLNLPLGITKMLIPAAMINLLGSPNHTGDAIYEGLSQVMQMPGVHIHLYGKKKTTPFRKMGHITVTNEEMSVLRVLANQVKNILKVKA